MSRSAAKSRDKSRAASLVLAPALPRPASVQNVETVDIVPGRLTEAAWVTMTTQDNGEEVVAEIMGELEAVVMDRCYQLYLQKQLVPFTATWAYESLVQMSDWLFLARDEGEGPESATLWGEDTEPEPCKSDSWAEGCVPVRYTSVSSHTPLLQLLDLHLAESVDPWDSDTQSKHQSPSRQDSKPQSPSRQDSKPQSPSRHDNKPQPLSRQDSKLQSPTKPEPPDRERTVLAKKRIVDLTEPEKLDKTEKIGPEEVQPSPYLTVATYKAQRRRQSQTQPGVHKALPPPLKTYKALFTPSGPTQQYQSLSVPQLRGHRPREVPVTRRLDPARLPQHHVWPEVEVLEPRPSHHSKERTGPQNSAPLRPNQDHHSMAHRATIIPLTAHTHQALPSKTRKKSLHHGVQLQRHVLRDGTQPRGSTVGYTPLSTGLDLDTIELVPGVAIGDPVCGTGENKPFWVSRLPELRPIRSSLPAMLWSLDQVVGGQSPRVSAPIGKH
ncbi:uncharacterized protein C2orf81 homolog isoform X2 [Salmo trutta]|uniref:uncharacterized protein C2orf81 homolog isoform X2 n=1 Tax=Salmo trutta TaxID=8032 RepID=UPI0011325B90|nr:uncharacterized protein C2orf81 homolog isoform X2 [Salmo trutta]